MDTLPLASAALLAGLQPGGTGDRPGVKTPAPRAVLRRRRNAGAEIRGTAEPAEDPGKAPPRAVSRKYLGEDPQPEPDEVARLIVRVIPERINTFSA